MDVTEERREQRQLRLDVALLAIPAKQRAQHERMADVVNPGTTPERVSFVPPTQRAPGSRPMVRSVPGPVK